MVRLLEGHFRQDTDRYPEVDLRTARYSIADRAAVFTRASPAYDLNVNGTIAEYAVDVPRTGNGLLIESAADNRIANNTTLGFVNGGAHSSVVDLDMPPLYPGTTVWRITKTASADTNFSNTTIATVAVSTQVVVSMYAWFPQDTTASAAIITQDSAASVGTSVGYDFTRKGTWQRIWRPLVTNAGTPNNGYQFRVTGMTDGHFCYATLLCVEYGLHLTSPIVTNGSIAARASDSAHLYTGIEFTTIFGDGNQGWAIGDFQVDQLTSPLLRYLFQIDNGGDVNRVFVAVTVSGNTQPYIGSTGGTVSSAVPVGTPFRMGIRWNSALVVSCKDGAALQTNSSFAVPVPFSTLKVGNNFAVNRAMNARMFSAWAGGTYPTDAQLQAACVYGANPNSIIPQS